MKKANAKGKRPGRAGGRNTSAELDPDEILPEYDFSGGVRSKYAARYAEGTNIVVLDPDVAAVFPTGTAVNEALRALAGIIERHGRGKPRRRRPARRTA